MSLLLALTGASGGSATAFPTGVSATSALGAVTATGAANVTATGVSATSALGTATGSGAGNTTAAGVSVTSALGTATASGNGTGAPTGQSTTASVGATVGTGDANTTATGVSATVSLGTATASGGSAVNGDAFPAGVSAAASLGTATGSGAGNTTAAGQSTTATIGAATGAGAANTSPAGQGTTASLGAGTGSGAANTTATGVSATTTLGTATATGGSGGGVDGNAYPTTLDLVTTNWGTPWADGGRRPKRNRLKLSKDAEAYPQGVEARTAHVHADAYGEFVVPYVPTINAGAFPYGVSAFSQLGRVEPSASAGALACMPAICAETGEVCAAGAGQASVIGIPISGELGGLSASVHVEATPVWAEECESFVGDVDVLAVKNPTDEELAIIAHLLLNSHSPLHRR